MKFKKSPRNGNLVVEVESENNRLLNPAIGPISALKEILVPIDFSECSKYAVRYGVALAKQFGGQVTLLSVVNDSHTSFEVGNPDYISAITAREKLYQAELKKVGEEGVGKFLKQTVVRSGRPYEEIVKAATDLNTDIIVISTHGQMGLAKVQLGSTAERVIRYAPCPVLVVREKQREFVVE